MIERLSNYKNSGLRWYRLTENEVTLDAPSVTTICEHIVHNLLKRWWIKNTKEEIDEKLTSSQDKGTGFHKDMENQVLGIDAPATSALTPVWNAWAKEAGIRQVQSEVPVFSKRFGYAGQMDGAFEIRGQPGLWVGDFKTGRNKPEMNKFKNEAYARAYGEMTGKTYGNVLFYINSRGVDMKPVQYNDYCFSQFLATLHTYKGLYFYELQKLGYTWLTHDCLSEFYCGYPLRNVG